MSAVTACVHETGHQGGCIGACNIILSYDTEALGHAHFSCCCDDDDDDGDGVGLVTVMRAGDVDKGRKAVKKTLD